MTTQLPPHLRPPKRSKAPWIAAGVAVALVVAGFLAVVVFEVQTLFTDDTVEEAGPVFASGATADDPPEAGVAETTTPPPAGGDAPAVTTVSAGTFEARDHPGEGTVTLLTDGAQTFVRFEDDFSTDNGPDLYAVAIVGGERVELGELKGNQGSQNYELPADVDPASVEAIQVWCKRFDATFTEAAVS